jgi:uncharacterized protein (DUF433 family)
MSIASIEHIEIDEKGTARIAGKRTKVIQIVMDKMANGWGPDEIHAHYPHLSLAEIHAAFAYYYDHQQELDAVIAQDLHDAEAMRMAAGESPVVAKIKLAGRLP